MPKSAARPISVGDYFAAAPEAGEHFGLSGIVR
jgi:hypothetical protein